MTDQRLLDKDTAILIITAPFYICAFIGLAVAGAMTDWWETRG